MTILGVKLTHDGGLALIEDGRLVFSYEMEKLNNFPRYSEFCIPFEEIGRILQDFGYDLATIDRIVIDGWSLWDPELVAETYTERKIIARINWNGRDVELTTDNIGGYGHIVTPDDDIMECNRFEENGLRYNSYLHVAGHVAGAYCTSAFAQRNESSFILVWDGGMPPQLFYYDAAANDFTSKGYLFPMVGLAYTTFAHAFEPFSAMKKNDMGIAGKAMAYVALGTVRAPLLQAYRDIFDNLKEMVDEEDLDIDTIALLTHQFVKEARKYYEAQGASDEDMLATFQEFVKELLVKELSARVALYPDLEKNLCMAGGCALNIKWNNAIRQTGVFNDIWVPPFPNDAGSAIGAACCEMLVNDGRRALDWNVYSGPPIGNGAEEFSDLYRPVPCTLEQLATILHEHDEPVVFLNGLAELGPRALGNRSILAPAVSPGMKRRLNEMKHREHYRPVAPICLEAHAPEVFTPGTPDPYMLFEHHVRKDWLDKVPAICHLDGTARLQTVSAAGNPTVHELLTHYYRLSGIPLLCNTSANFNGSGFFPDVHSAMRWNKSNLVWSNNVLYVKEGFVLHARPDAVSVRAGLSVG